MIFLKPPANFNPKMHVAACFVLFENEFLFLKTGNHKKLAGLWGVPAGKLEEGEKPIHAMIRETKEETGIDIAKKDFKEFKTVYIKYPEMDFIYNMFYTKLKQKPKIIMDGKEHSEYKWVTEKEALKLQLIPDEGECIKMFYDEVIKS
ncbi:MAG: NUDIX hydrolase [archaeon]